ncbi:MAG: cell wall-binding repeat-containing protein [Desulfitobacteriaceae bacterium]|nr:cell wall-binding repeat-containing protein [Desulfitobacteriaceae bacterium]
MAEPAVNRISGANRYGTAVAISQEGWETADTVVLARGDDYADALAGVPLAYALDAPMLLTHKDRLTGSTKDEILRLQAKKVYVLGGTGAVSEAVEDAVKALGLDVVRIFGANRFGTAAAVAKELAKMRPATKAVLAYGLDFPDALAAASYAAVYGYPILLVRTDALTSATETVIAELNIDDFIVVGGTGVISEALFNSLSSATRIAGKNRFETAVELANYFEPYNDWVYLATGLDFADAITGGVLAAKTGNGMLLVRNDRIPTSVQQYLPQVSYATIFGGPGVVGECVADEVQDLLYTPDESYVVRGRITDKNGLPIQGAEISAALLGGMGGSIPFDLPKISPNNQPLTFSDENGYYSLALGSLNEVYSMTVNIRAEGFFGHRSWGIDIDEIPSQLNCEMLPLGQLFTVEGTVLNDEYSLPIPNAKIDVRLDNDSRWGEGRWGVGYWDIFYKASTYTNSNGNYVLNLPGGLYDCDISCENYTTPEYEYLEVRKDIQNHNWVLGTLYEISGKLTYENGDPVPEGAVEIVGEYFTPYNHIVWADENGNFTAQCPVFCK